MPFDLCFIFRYAFPIVVVVVAAIDREKAAAAERSRVVTKANSMSSHLSHMRKSFEYVH
jgi:hypothetical protein